MVCVSLDVYLVLWSLLFLMEMDELGLSAEQVKPAERATGLPNW